MPYRAVGTEARPQRPWWAILFALIFGILALGTLTKGVLILATAFGVLAISALRRWQGKTGRTLWYIGATLLLGSYVAAFAFALGRSG